MDTNAPNRLSQLPLWRLLVLLDDAERTVGPDSSTARTLATALRNRLRGENGPRPRTATAKGGRR